jgi:cytoskeletal protein RodZ
MALFISQKDDRTELQKQIAAELQRKDRENSKIVDRPDGVKDSQYVKGTKTTSNSAWIWLVVAVLLVGVIIWLTVISRSR